MEKAAVVLLNYNGLGFMQKFLPDLLALSRPHSVYVIDNASTDNSIQWLKDNHDEVKIIELKENHGFSGGYNIGLRHVESEYYILVNTDVQVTDNWISPVLKLMDEDDTIAACQPKIRSYHQPQYFEYAGAAGGFVDALGYPFCRGRIFNTLEKDNGQYDDTRPIFWASGACFFIRASLFHMAGGFDYDFFAHMEEIDLCWLLHTAGFRVYYCSESTVFHVGGGTLPQGNPQKSYLNFRNNLTMLYKNSNFFQFLWKYPMRLVLDCFAALREVYARKGKVSVMIVKAHLHFWGMYKKNKMKKITTKSVRKGFRIKELYNGSIVLQYFLNKKKTFGELNF